MKKMNAEKKTKISMLEDSKKSELKPKKTAPTHLKVLPSPSQSIGAIQNDSDQNEKDVIPAWWECPEEEYPMAPSSLQKFVLERSLNNAYCLSPCTVGNVNPEAYFWFYCLIHDHIYAVEFSRFMKESPGTNGCPVCSRNN
ncbi:MAG: hypothetical protein SCI25_01835 [Desulfuromonadales bacterium]|nr:hypothetical protein [Desulfuromonadales bacterium]MDW7756188.1 hypothetical protein [Desulfuromonadales bacterium]